MLTHELSGHFSNSDPLSTKANRPTSVKLKLSLIDALTEGLMTDIVLPIGPPLDMAYDAARGYTKVQ